MVAELNWTSLDTRHKINILAILYKAIHGLTGVAINHLCTSVNATFLFLNEMYINTLFSPNHDD